MRLIHGIDIVKIERIGRLYLKYSAKFLEKVYTNNEIEYIKVKNYSIETMAGIFASKEAVSKALGTGIGKIGWKDIEISHNESGKPYVKLLKKNKLDIVSLELSISHEKDYAIASVVGFCIKH